MRFGKPAAASPHLASQTARATDLIKMRKDGAEGGLQLAIGQVRWLLYRARGSGM